MTRISPSRERKEIQSWWIFVLAFKVVLLLKQSSLIGVFWGAFARANPDRNAANMAELFDWFKTGHLKPHIGGEYPLDRYAEALDAVMERRAQGKVVLTMPGAELNKRTTK